MAEAVNVGVMSLEEATGWILRELERSGSPLPVAAALNVLGINPFHATEDQVRFLLLAVSASDRLRMVRDEGAGIDVVTRPLPIEGLLDVFHRVPDPLPNPLELIKPGRGDPVAAQRVAAMKRFFIDGA